MKVQVSTPYFKGLFSARLLTGMSGIIEFNRTFLTILIPYTMRLKLTKTNFDAIGVDYFVGGYFLMLILLNLATFSFY